MSEKTVYLVPTTNSGGVDKMHSEKDCHRLKMASGTIMEKDRSVVETHREECAVCCGSKPPKPECDTQATRKLLLRTNANEV